MIAVLLAALLGQVSLSDEGGPKKVVKHINCVGAGVVCSSSSTAGTITVAGGGGAVPAACAAGQALTSNGSAISCTSTITASSIDGENVTGAVPVAETLSMDPTDCGANQVARGINTQGNLSCSAIADADVPNNITVDVAATATALASNPTACGLGEFVTDIAANGTLTCGTPAVGAATDLICLSTCVADAEIAALAAAKLTGTVATARLGSGTADGTTFLRGDQTWAAPAGGAGNFVEVEVDFGASGSDTASTVVTGQAWVATTSKVICAPTLLSTADRAEGAEDALIEGLTVGIHSRVNATGFTAVASITQGRAYGKFKIHCTGG